MAKYRDNLPIKEPMLFLTDGGLETSLIFHNGFDLPEFAAFPLLETPQGKDALTHYFQSYIDIAKKHHVNFILESPTWRASRRWGLKLGFSAHDLAHFNREAIFLMEILRTVNEDEETTIVISCCLGPKGDGYMVDEKMSPKEAQAYHSEQIKIISETEADVITAFTLSYSDEAIGIANACKTFHIPVVIGFTLETDGTLPSGESLQEAIEIVDRMTGEYPVYYMINCVHPLHIQDILKGTARWKMRIQAIRANASAKSHAQLDEAEKLYTGNPKKLGDEYCQLMHQLPNLHVFGGCCGTDDTHLSAITHSVKVCKAF